MPARRGRHRKTGCASPSRRQTHGRTRGRIHGRIHDHLRNPTRVRDQDSRDPGTPNPAHMGGPSRLTQAGRSCSISSGMIVSSSHIFTLVHFTLMRAVPQFGQVRSTQATPVREAPRCPHCGQTQYPEGPAARGPPIRPGRRPPGPRPPATRALSASASRAHSTTSSSHGTHLLVNSMRSPESPPPPLASRHGEDAGAEPALLPGFDNLFQVTGHEGYDPDAVGGDKSVHGPRNGAAHQGADFRVQRAGGPSEPSAPWKIISPSRRRSARPGLDHAYPPGRVKNRGDAMIPVGKCRFHSSIPGLPLLL